MQIRNGLVKIIDSFTYMSRVIAKIPFFDVIVKLHPANRLRFVLTGGIKFIAFKIYCFQVCIALELWTQTLCIINVTYRKTQLELAHVNVVEWWYTLKSRFIHLYQGGLFWSVEDNHLHTASELTKFLTLETNQSVIRTNGVRGNVIRYPRTII